MATLISFHAHPDDEAIACGGSIAKAVADGHRVVIVSATKGEHGEVADGFLSRGERLADRRVGELAEAAGLLGAQRTEFLGYSDSGMMGTAENDGDGSFWRAEVDEAAERLAGLLAGERADVMTVYDPDGSYGHPDHIQVHRVGVRAAELIGATKVYESVIPSERVRASMERLGELGFELSDDIDRNAMGVPEDTITTRVDVAAFLDVKRAAMAAHASQIPETSFFLAMPPEVFAEAFGTETFRLLGARAGLEETDLFEGLP